MDTRSEYLLQSVDPALAKVIRKASQEPQSFKVIQGKRSLDEQGKLLFEGKSKTIRSRHLGGKDGLSDAVDIVALTDGKVDWAVGKEKEVYGQIWKQIETASKELGIPLEWGGSWHSFPDYGHIQLPWSVDREH